MSRQEKNSALMATHWMLVFLVGAGISVLFLCLFQLPSRSVCLLIAGSLFVLGAWMLVKNLQRTQWARVFLSGPIFILGWLGLEGITERVRSEVMMMEENADFITAGIGVCIFGMGAWLFLCCWMKWHRGFLLFSIALVGLFSFQLGKDLAFDINILADTIVEQQIQTRVTEIQAVRVSSGQHESRRACMVRLEENDLTSGRWFPVDKAVYDNLAPGDEVQLILHPGALGQPWLECVPAETERGAEGL